MPEDLFKTFAVLMLFLMRWCMMLDVPLEVFSLLKKRLLSDEQRYYNCKYVKRVQIHGLFRAEEYLKVETVQSHLKEGGSTY